MLFDQEHPPTSIRNSVREIINTNKRPEAGGYYVSSEELAEILIVAYSYALDSASLEVAEGRYEVEELSKMVEQDETINSALQKIVRE